MQPLFTIHAGEYLVGSHIEQNLVDPSGNKVNVWVPSKDTGVDILVTDESNIKTSSIQVKFSKDFLVTQKSIVTENVTKTHLQSLLPPHHQPEVNSYRNPIHVGYALRRT